jgi:glycosyltransferase involved in cell wall biosynthesis
MVLAKVPAIYYGTSPNKFFDYLAAGLPVVNTYPGWLADLINQNGCGVAVAPNDPVAFAAALIALADSPERCQEMRVRARQLAEREFAREELAAEFVEFLTRTHADL